ncbi:hypothetical protein GF325_04630, partial [Candidatus Bathyarchaeota archaeon]|nr:hypothetical protein [Candidatus Bathyarchaeota archaeon]
MEQKKISQGFLVAGKELGTISLPEDFLGNLKEKAGVFLVLFMPQEDRTKIAIIPYSGTELIKVIVHLTTFSPHTIRT